MILLAVFLSNILGVLRQYMINSAHLACYSSEKYADEVKKE